MHLPAPDLESNELEEKKKRVEGDMYGVDYYEPPPICGPGRLFITGVR